MEASELLFETIKRRSTTWRKVKEEIYKDFFYLPEQDRIKFADLWDELSSSEEFNLRKMNKDKSSDQTIYYDLAEHFIKKLDKIKEELSYS